MMGTVMFRTVYGHSEGDLETAMNATEAKTGGHIIGATFERSPKSGQYTAHLVLRGPAPTSAPTGEPSTPAGRLRPVGGCWPR